MAERKFPNLFIVGAMKAGTSTLHTALGSHPEIFRSPIKEPGYFAGLLPYPQPYLDGKPAPDPEGRWYHAMFEPAYRDARVRYAVESTTDYAKLPRFPGCAERIGAFNPEARIIYVMRDPVLRSISHYWHNVRTEQEKRGLMEVVREDPEVIAFSDYARQLQPYFDNFPREQIHLMTLEAFAADWHGTLRSIFEWLGVDANHRVRETEKLNANAEIFYVPRAGMTWMVRLQKTRTWRAMSWRLPPKFRNVFHKLSLRLEQRDDREEPEAVAYLRPILAEKARTLSEWIGREFPEWTTTFPDGYPAPAVASAARSDHDVGGDAGRS